MSSQDDGWGGKEPLIPSEYQPDPAEEAYYASPAGLRSSAAGLRRLAAEHIARAEAMETEADAKDGGGHDPAAEFMREERGSMPGLALDY